MLTINEIINKLNDAKTKNVESVFLETLFTEILNCASESKTQGSILFDNFDREKDFDFFVKTLNNIRESDYQVRNIVTKAELIEEDYNVEVYFDLEKENKI